MVAGFLNKISRRLTYTRMIALSFLTVILLGSLLLCLPVASRAHEWTSFADAAFTATSATCVTGLIVFDTFTYWSLFGQLVILSLIQIGGLGFMTVISMFSIFLKRRISLRERRLLMESAGTMRVSGIVKLVHRVCTGTLIIESAGALVLATRFCPELGVVRGIYYSVFHSVSAFCNAGFDIMGFRGKFSSFTTCYDDPVICLTLVLLIIVGGIGFFVWDDIIKCKADFRKYCLHTKIVLSVSAVLLLLGWICFFIFERGSSMAGMNVFERVLASLFHSATVRTAGFNSIDLGKLSESGSLLTIVLMLIGGSPGSTAGGIKTTTLLVLLLGAVSASRHTNHITVFKRRLEDDALHRASAIFIIYITALLVSTVVICAFEPLTFEKVLFEVTSAAGTVGLSNGATAVFSLPSRIILMVLMFGGRVGGLSLMLVLAEKRTPSMLSRPCEKILIG